MADAGQSFRGRGNGVGGSNPGASRGNASSYGNDSKAYWADQDRKAEERAARAKGERQQREQYNRQQDEQRRQEYQRKVDKAGEDFIKRYGVDSETASAASAGFASGAINVDNKDEANRTLRDILVAIRGEGKILEHDSKLKDREASGNISAGVLMAGLIRDITGLIGRAPSARTGLDLLSSGLQIEGTAVGAVGGFLAGGNSAAGAQFGKEAGAFYGSALTREIQTKTELARATAQYRAITGQQYGMQDLTRFGIDHIQGSSIAGSLAKASTRGVADNDLLATVAAKKIADLDDALIFSIEKQSRATGKSFASRASSILGVANRLHIRSGLYPDMFSQSAAMIDQAASTGVDVDSDATTRTMFELNKIGGAFAIGRPTALHNQQALAKGVANPTSAFGQATMYSIMRNRMKPGDDFFDMQVDQENAIDHPEIMKEFIDRMSISGGRNKALDKQMLYNAFSQYGLSKTSASQLYDNREQLGSMTQEEYSAMMGRGEMNRQGENLTAPQDQKIAAVTNAFTISFVDGINVIKDQWVIEMAKANTLIASEAEKTFSSMMKSLVDKILPGTPDTNDDVYERNKKNGRIKINGVSGSITN